MHVHCEYIATEGNNHVIMLSVKPHPEFIPYVFDGKPYWRVLASTRLMPQARYQQLLMERANKLAPWDASEALQLKLSDLDHAAILNAISESISKGRLEPRFATEDPLQALRLLKLTADGKLLNAAAVLFAHDPTLSYPQCLLRLAKFKGCDKSKILDSKHIHGHAFSLLKHAEDFCLRHMSIEGEYVPGKMARRDIPEYPPRALREAMVNAIAHRDYTIPGGSISLMIFDDRLEITSHGHLPSGLTVSDLVQEHDSQPRNACIAQALYRIGVVESVGTGTQEMVDECKKFGKRAPEYVERANTFVVKFLSQAATQQLMTLTTRQQQIFDMISSKQIVTAGEILKLLPDHPAERTLRDDLAKLKKLGMIETQGKGRGANWYLVQNKAVNKGNKAE